MMERAGRVERNVAIATGAGSTPVPGIGTGTGTGKATAVVLAHHLRAVPEPSGHR